MRHLVPHNPPLLFHPATSSAAFFLVCSRESSRSCSVLGSSLASSYWHARSKRADTFGSFPRHQSQSPAGPWYLHFPLAHDADSADPSLHRHLEYVQSGFVCYLQGPGFGVVQQHREHQCLLHTDLSLPADLPWLPDCIRGGVARLIICLMSSSDLASCEITPPK